MEGYTLWTSHGEEVVTGDGKRGMTMMDRQTCRKQIQWIMKSPKAIRSKWWQIWLQTLLCESRLRKKRTMQANKKREGQV
jgi:hypothetical protein